VILLDNKAGTNLSADDDAKPIAAKYLSKWRPGFIEQQKMKIEESNLTSASATQNGNPVVA
jgi:hypothetical protein